MTVNQLILVVVFDIISMQLMQNAYIILRKPQIVAVIYIIRMHLGRKWIIDIYCKVLYD